MRPARLAALTLLLSLLLATPATAYTFYISDPYQLLSLFKPLYKPIKLVRVIGNMTNATIPTLGENDTLIPIVTVNVRVYLPKPVSGWIALQLHDLAWLARIFKSVKAIGYNETFAVYGNVTQDGKRVEVFTVYVRGTFPAGLSTVTLQFGFAEKQNVIPPPMYVSTEKISLRPGTTLIIPLCQVRITASQPVKPTFGDVESAHYITLPGILPIVMFSELKHWWCFTYCPEPNVKTICINALFDRKYVHRALLLNPLDFHIVGTDNFGNPMFVYTVNRTVYRDYLGATEPVFNLSAVLDLDTEVLSKLPIYSYYSATYASTSITYQFMAAYAYDESLRYLGSEAALRHFVELVDKKKYMFAGLLFVGCCCERDTGFLRCTLSKGGVIVESLDEFASFAQDFANDYNIEFLSMTAGGDVIGAVLVEAPLSNLTDIDAALVAGCGNIDVVIVRDGRVVASLHFDDEYPVTEGIEAVGVPVDPVDSATVIVYAPPVPAVTASVAGYEVVVVGREELLIVVAAVAAIVGIFIVARRALGGG